MVLYASRRCGAYGQGRVHAPPRLTTAEPGASPDTKLPKGAAKTFHRGDQSEAHRLVGGAIALNAKNETAWLLRASLASNVREANACLKQVLQLNPHHEKAWELLEKVRNTARQQSILLEDAPERLQ